MNGTRLQAKVYAGQGKAASRIGQPFDVYRPGFISSPDPINPISPWNKAVAALQAHFTSNGGYMAPNSYGKATWQAMLDGSQVNVGDYLVGTDGTDYFIAAKQPLLPILAVGCNRVLSLTQGGTSPVAVGWPASVLIESTRGNAPLEDIAGNPSTPHWRALMPAVAGITPSVADLVTDDLLRAYFVTAAELTDLGWRLSMQESTQLNDSVKQHYATIIGLIGKVVTLRQTTTAATKAGATYAIGTLTINLVNCPAGWAGTAIGDTFLNVGNVHTITNAVAPVAGTATGVTFTPPLITAMASGYAVTVTHNTDSPVKCLIGGYDKTLVNGSTIQVSDLRVVMATKTTGGATLPTPKTTDKLIFDGMAPAIVSVRPEYAGDTIAVWEIQARG